MPSFDVVSETNMQEIDNALNSAKRELSNRWDFKGSKSSFENDKEGITILADNDMQLKALTDMLKVHLTKRSVDTKCLDFGKEEMASGGAIRVHIKLKKGIDQESAKKITKGIKEAGMKIQASIQGEQVRVTGKQRDDLQEAMTFIKGLGLDLPLQFTNFRD